MEKCEISFPFFPEFCILQIISEKEEKCDPDTQRCQVSQVLVFWFQLKI